MRRFSDIFFAIILIIIFILPLIFISLVIKFTSNGPVLYWSDRFGRNNKIFKMPKLRTMRINSPVVASNLIENPEQYITPFGKILRNFSLDELPQLICILGGSMSFIGPRPALFNQKDLIELRTRNNIHLLCPGITGWAQVNGRDQINIYKKVDLEIFYRDNRSFILDCKIVLLTIKKVLFRKNIIH
tara:strand:- start:2940 stop:3500 length:561 start_codon:yes stop_codon:yes gene_type:complete